MALIISNVSFSVPKYAIGDFGTLTYTIKNSNSWTGTLLYVRLTCVVESSRYTSAEIYWSDAVSIPANATRTFTHSFEIDPDLHTQAALDAVGTRSLSPRLDFTLGRDYQGGTYTDNEYLALPNILLLDMHYAPSIPIFTVSRSPNADSTGAAVDLTCTLAEGADPAYAGLALTLQWKEEDAATFPAENTLAVTVADALASGGTTVTPDFTVETGKAYILRATFTDGIDSAFSEIKLSKAEKTLNVHPTSKNIGLGQFAVPDLDADDVKRLDMTYRPYFHEGARDAAGREIIGKTDYSTDRVDTGIKWIDGKTIYRKVLTFGAVSTGGTATISTGESAIDTLITLRGAGNSGTSGQVLPLPFAHYSNVANNRDITISSKSSNPSVVIRCGSGSNLPNGGYIIIEYTRPT